MQFEAARREFKREANIDTALAYINSAAKNRQRLELKPIISLHRKFDERMMMEEMMLLETALCNVSPENLYYNRHSIQSLVDQLMTIARGAGLDEPRILHVVLKYGPTMVSTIPLQVLEVYVVDWSGAFLKITVNLEMQPTFVEDQSLEALMESINNARSRRGRIDVFSRIF